MYVAGKFLHISMTPPTCVTMAPKKQGHVEVAKVLFGQPLIDMRQDTSFAWV